MTRDIIMKIKIDKIKTLEEELAKLSCSKAIVDFDGVIVNSEPIHDLSYKYTLYKIGIDASLFDFTKYVGNNERTIWSKISEDYSLEHSVDELFSIRNVFVNDLISNQEPSWFIKTILEFFKNKDGAVLLSSGNGNLINNYLIKWGLEKYFDNTYMSKDFNKPINKSLVLEKLIESFDEDVVVIEDSISYVLKGLDNNSKVIWIKHILNTEHSNLLNSKGVNLVLTQ